jgi:alkylhydroperoxidase family enzyme
LEERCLDDATMALLLFAELLTDGCAPVGADDVASLRTHGFDDRAISSCVQVVAYFNYINRIAEGLWVAPEDWIDQIGKERTP